MIVLANNGNFPQEFPENLGTVLSGYVKTCGKGVIFTSWCAFLLHTANNKKISQELNTISPINFGAGFNVNIQPTKLVISNIQHPVIEGLNGLTLTEGSTHLESSSDPTLNGISLATIEGKGNAIEEHGLLLVF